VTEIPQWAMEKAREVATLIFGDSGWYKQDAEIIARALATEREAATMAERERCALHIERRSGSIPFRQEIARELRLGLEHHD